MPFIKQHAVDQQIHSIKKTLEIKPEKRYTRTLQIKQINFIIGRKHRICSGLVHQLVVQFPRVQSDERILQ